MELVDSSSESDFGGFNSENDAESADKNLINFLTEYINRDINNADGRPSSSGVSVAIVEDSADEPMPEENIQQLIDDGTDDATGDETDSHTDSSEYSSSFESIVFDDCQKNQVEFG